LKVLLEKLILKCSSNRNERFLNFPNTRAETREYTLRCFWSTRLAPWAIFRIKEKDHTKEQQPRESRLAACENLTKIPPAATDRARNRASREFFKRGALRVMRNLRAFATRNPFELPRYRVAISREIIFSPSRRRRAASEVFFERVWLWKEHVFKVK